MSIAISFCFFLALMIIVGVVSSWRKSSSDEAYLMAGRSHGRFMIALSGAASATSGFIMIGAVGAGYTLGLMAVLMPLSWFLGDLAFWTLFPARINHIGRESKCNTVPEFISYIATGKRASGLRKFVALIIIVFVGMYAVGQFLAAGKAINGVFDISITSAIALAALVIVVYSAKGGLQSSIPTQFVQAIIMLFTTIGMFAVALYVGNGPANIIAELQKADAALLMLDGGRGLWLLLVFMLGFATTAFTFDIGQPHLLIRIMATKSPDEAAKARWIYLAFMQATWISMSLFGLMMVVLLPDIGDAEQALPVFARTNLHPLLAGAVLAGIFAAVASTLDALLLVLSSSLGVDLVPVTYKKKKARYGSNYQVGVTLLVAAVTTAGTMLVVNSTSVFDIIVYSATGLGVTIGCAMLITIMRWRTCAPALVISALGALVVSGGWRLLGLSDFLVEGLPGFLTGIVVHQICAAFFLNSAAPTEVSPEGGDNEH